MTRPSQLPMWNGFVAWRAVHLAAGLRVTSITAKSNGDMGRCSVRGFGLPKNGTLEHTPGSTPRRKLRCGCIQSGASGLEISARRIGDSR